MQHHKYSLTELNDMVPWEREIYVNLLIAYIKEEKEKRERERRENKESKMLQRPNNEKEQQKKEKE